MIAAVKKTCMHTVGCSAPTRRDAGFQPALPPQNLYKTCTFVVQKGGGVYKFSARHIAPSASAVLLCVPLRSLRLFFVLTPLKTSPAQNRQNRRSRRFSTHSTTLYQVL